MSIWPTKNADSQLRHAPSFVPKVKNFLIQNCDKIVNRHHLPTLKLPKIYKSVCMQGQQFILNNFTKYFLLEAIMQFLLVQKIKILDLRLHLIFLK